MLRKAKHLVFLHHVLQSVLLMASNTALPPIFDVLMSLTELKKRTTFRGLNPIAIRKRTDSTKTGSVAKRCG